MLKIGALHDEASAKSKIERSMPLTGWCNVLAAKNVITRKRIILPIHQSWLKVSTWGAQQRLRLRLTVVDKI